MVCKLWCLFRCSIRVFECGGFVLIVLGCRCVFVASRFLVFGCGNCGWCFMFVDLLLVGGVGFGVWFVVICSRGCVWL